MSRITKHILVSTATLGLLVPSQIVFAANTTFLPLSATSHLAVESGTGAPLTATFSTDDESDST